MKKILSVLTTTSILLLIAACTNPPPPLSPPQSSATPSAQEPTPEPTPTTQPEEEAVEDHDHNDDHHDHEEDSDHDHEPDEDEHNVQEDAEAEPVEHGEDGHSHILVEPEMIGGVMINAFNQFELVSVTSDDEYVYISHPTGLPTHPMMTGITNWQQQVPIPQDYTGQNSWAIPLNPVFTDNGLSTTETSFRGAIAVAVNGIPIFTAVNNRGEDAFEIGELDEWGGHSGRADDYHYHIPPVHLEEIVGKGQPIAYAFDGFPIYGETNAELDEHFGIQNEDGSYQYHTVLSQSPYFIPSFRGEVNYVGDEISPQARTFGVRPATNPLRGTLEITNFEAAGENGYSLTYVFDGSSYIVNYGWDDSGLYTYEFVNPDGSSTVETYQKR
ncbi:MAG: YHYH protein [Chloroflexota bacterium]